VIPVVFIIGVLNLVLGFALAVLLERQIVVPLPRWRAERDEEDVVFEIPAAPAALEEMLDTLPQRWLDLLEANDAEFGTFVEATVEILKLEVDSYREDLLDIEDLVRSAIRKKKPEAIHDAIQVLVGLNNEWMDHQQEALDVMVASRDRLGEYAPIGNQLESVLLDQMSLIRAQCRELVNLDLKKGDATVKCIIRGIGQLVALAHDLRDRIRSATLLIICNEGKLASSDRRLQQDPLTGLPNRMGIELLFQNWWNEDPHRRRLASAAMIDMDRFGELNNQVSARVGDRILKAIAIYLEQLVGNESGLERVFRFAGQRFFIFLGDVGSRTATTRIEKIRQSLEATQLQFDGQKYGLTIRAGVTDLRRDDDTQTLYERLEGLVDAAQHAGRNRTGLDDNSGNGIIQPEPQEVKRRIIRVE